MTALVGTPNEPPTSRQFEVERSGLVVTVTVQPGGTTVTAKLAAGSSVRADVTVRKRQR